MSDKAKQQTEQDRYLEGRENLARFFILLEKIDRRENPHLYQNETEKPKSE